MKIKSNISWFSIVEVMIAIFIFSMWMASIFMVISSSMNINHFNKNQIIASNLAAEQIEIIRNIRDDNYINFRKWNYIPNSAQDFSKVFETWKYYKVENNYNSLVDYSFKINEIIDFWEWETELNWKMLQYRLYLNDKNQYTFDSSWTWTIFYRYLKIEKLKDENWVIIPDAMKLRSKVIWHGRWYHEFEISTILTNFNRY